jgi:hypothetical protein
VEHTGTPATRHLPGNRPIRTGFLVCTAIDGRRPPPTEAVIAASGTAMDAIKWAGAAYLCYLGVQNPKVFLLFR